MSVVTSTNIILRWIKLSFSLTNSVSCFSWSTFEVYNSESELGFCSASLIKTSVELHQMIWLTIATTCPKWVLSYSFLSTPRLVKSVSPCIHIFLKKLSNCILYKVQQCFDLSLAESFFPLNGTFSPSPENIDLIACVSSSISRRY